MTSLHNKPCFDLTWATVPGQPAAPGDARDPLRAQGRRLGIPSGSPAGRGAPSVRESAARGRDLSEQNPAVHSAAAPPVYVLVLYGETDGVLEFSTLKYYKKPMSLHNSCWAQFPE